MLCSNNFTLLPVPLLLPLSAFLTLLAAFSPPLPPRASFALFLSRFAAPVANGISADPTCDLSVNIREVSNIEKFMKWKEAALNEVCTEPWSWKALYARNENHIGKVTQAIMIKINVLE